MSRWIAAALADESWRSLAALDAATRMVGSMVRSGGLRRRKQAADLIDALIERSRPETKTEAIPEVIPEHYWVVRPSPPGPGEGLRMRGAVLVSVAGRRQAEPAASPGEQAPAVPPPLSPELVAALAACRS